MKALRIRRQSGATLMEVLIAMTISLVATAAMVAMMSNSLGTTARIIHMTKLTDDMRVALQMMGRDVRRSSYNVGSMYCYANEDCGSDASGVTLAGDVNINDAGTCFTFLLDRGWDRNSTNDGAGGFRRVTINGVGVLEMWTGDSAPDCSDAAGAAGWVEITDPENMDITTFAVDDSLSYTRTILDDGSNTIQQKVRKIRMNMAGRLVMDNSITRTLEDIVDVRNDLLL
ncbi:MAG: prepilin-type N-terminal cleavage/methylation domain-containing protein [Xanthomonadales bacterium]|jgi:type II secretory pathway pseudopilin PulG|nr:prepilin-type N-terminal cleavage/methylation domain-containing protein [Xanthomonadales bacterium]